MASIHKREDGTWRGQVNKNGTRKSFSGKTKKEVEKKIQAYMEDINSYGVELEKTTVTVSEWLYKHLFTNIHPSVANGTFDRYMCLYNAHIKDSNFGKIRVNVIRQIDVQNFFNTKTEISTDALRMIRYLLKQAFDFAISNNLIRINPVTSIKLPKSQSAKRKIEVFTIEETNKFIAALDSTKYKSFFITAMLTGMRLGELVALKWENVDLENKKIEVKESYRRTTTYDSNGNSSRIIDKKTPKTENSKRILPIPNNLCDILKDHKTKSITEYVFSSTQGNHVTPENIRRIQIKMCKDANMPYKNFHALRHTYATRLIENGVDIKTVSTLLGHSSIEITLNTYVHSTDDTKVSAVATLENIVLGCTDNKNAPNMHQIKNTQE